MANSVVGRATPTTEAKAAAIAMNFVTAAGMGTPEEVTMPGEALTEGVAIIEAPTSKVEVSMEAADSTVEVVDSMANFGN
jgi:hypothetical protein